MMKYQNGREVSPKVFQAVRYISKVGVMTKATWVEHFAVGSERWKRKQLRCLLQSKIFKKYPYEEVHDTYVLGSRGIEILYEMKWSKVHLIQPKYIKHDETIAKGLLELEDQKICQRWITEGELKCQRSSAFRLHGMEGGAKYPDAVFKLEGKQNSQIVALEYEKTSKSGWRYNKAIKAYRDSGEFNSILFIVETKAIEDLVKRSIRFVGDSVLGSRIGFISVQDWLKSPSEASIRGLGRGRNLKEMSLMN